MRFQIEIIDEVRPEDKVQVPHHPVSPKNKTQLTFIVPTRQAGQDALPQASLINNNNALNKHRTRRCRRRDIDLSQKMPRRKPENENRVRRECLAGAKTSRCKRRRRGGVLSALGKCRRCLRGLVIRKTMRRVCRLQRDLGMNE